MKIQFYLFLFFTSIALACEPDLEQPYEIYTIKEGNHGSNYAGIQFLQSSSLRFSAIFNKSAIYTSKEPVNQHDINKLLGFADCNVHHHVNSARFGWRWLDGKLEILAYCYANKERITKSIGFVELNQSFEYSITVSKEQYLFELEGFPMVTMPRSSSCEVGSYYMLFPYFGGDEVAPQDISIKLLTQY